MDDSYSAEQQPGQAPLAKRSLASAISKVRSSHGQAQGVCGKAIIGPRSGVRSRDKFVIASFYLARAVVFGMPRFLSNWRAFLLHSALGDAAVMYQAGILRCRRGTNDRDCANPAYEPEVTRWLLRQSPLVFVDIGAHIGRYTIIMARRLRAHGTVIALEPDLNNYLMLRANGEQNGVRNAILLNVACPDKDGKANLWWRSHDRAASSLLADGVGQHALKIQARTLDGILREYGIDRVDILKIDAEGAEARIFLRARTTISRNPQVHILFESWDAEHLKQYKSALHRMGFQISQVDRFNYLAYREAACL